MENFKVTWQYFFDSLLYTIIMDTRGEQQNPSQEEFQPLWQKRPADIQEYIDRRFEKTQLDRFYPVVGRSEYRFADDLFTASDILQTLVTERMPVHILDVGAGDGAFMDSAKKRFQERVRVHGISAHSYGANTQDSTLKIGNAENLLNYYDPNSMDFIVSAATVRHLIDPAGAITQMYEVLKPNGIMLVDEVILRRIHNKLGSFVRHLSDQGYTIAADYEYNIRGNYLAPDRFRMLAIRKTHPHLQLPLQYDAILKDEMWYIHTIPLENDQIDIPTDMKEFMDKMRELKPEVDHNGYYDDDFLSKYTQMSPEVARKQAIEEWDLRIDTAKRTPNRIKNVPLMEEMRALLPAVLGLFINNFRNPSFIRQKMNRIGIQLKN